MALYLIHRLSPYSLLCALFLLMNNPLAGHAEESAQPRENFDTSWRFLKGDIKDGEKLNFDDASWRMLDVPHDWSIEGPFDAQSPAGGAGAFLPGGVGWYRKHFTLPADALGRRVFIEFDGIMANSDVWINGTLLGHRPCGYVSFRYELTEHLSFGADKPNLLAVRADNAQQPASRWYAGAGIYRHVRLLIANPVHLEYHGVVVSTSQVADDRATVRVKTTVVNQSDAPHTVSVLVGLIDPAGKSVLPVDRALSVTIAPGKSAEFSSDHPVPQPSRWDIEHPALYRAVTTVSSDNVKVDEETTPFGIREFHFAADTGFWLNGRNLKLKGVCLHQDGGAFGVAVPLGVWERRFEQLKMTGVNAIRTAHNPVAPEFLDLCDRMGLLVMDEMFDCWTVGKNPYDYHLFFDEWSLRDTRDTVRRDRNHPSIILYSAGNEIRDTPQPELAKRILGSLLEAFHAEDPSRPVTQALFRPNSSHDYTDGLADMLDVVGQNYRESEILNAHRDEPTRKIVGTENAHNLSSWLALRDNPPYAGQFLWSGIDYLGEAKHWPEISRSTGLFDRAGTWYPSAFQRQSWWSDKPMVYIARRTGASEAASVDPGYEKLPPPRQPARVLFSDWTPVSLDPHLEEVEVYSNAAQVELTLNGKSLGIREHPADDSPFCWKVSFEPGVLLATARNREQTVATHELRTAEKAARIVLNTDCRGALHASWDDVCFVRAEVVDAHGVRVPSAHDLISFKVSGPGIITAVDNGDNATAEAFHTSERHAYEGQCVAVLKAAAPSGDITLEANAAGLAGASIVVGTMPLRRSTGDEVGRGG